MKVWSGKQVDYLTSKVLMELKYIHINLDKLEVRAVKCVLLGSGNLAEDQESL